MRLLLAIAIDDKIKEVRGQLTWSKDGYTGGRGCLLWPLDAFKVSIEEQLQELLAQESLIYRNQKELTDTTLREREREPKYTKFSTFLSNFLSSSFYFLSPYIWVTTFNRTYEHNSFVFFFFFGLCISVQFKLVHVKAG